MVLRSLKPSKEHRFFKNTEVDMFWFTKNIEKILDLGLKNEGFYGSRKRYFQREGVSK
jgi:hypothetical protein